jgi:hypothetical protein
MSDLEAKMDEVLAAAERLSKPPKRDWTRLIGLGITIIVLIAGIITSWATNNAAVAEIQRDQVKIEERVEKAESNLHDVQLKAVHDSSVLESVKEDVQEIKQDVKTLLGQ